MYLTTFWILVVVAFLAHFYTRKELPKIGDAVFKRLRRRYLVIYLLARRSSAEHLIYNESAASHGYGLESHCR